MLMHDGCSNVYLQFYFHNTSLKESQNGLPSNGFNLLSLQGYSGLQDDQSLQSLTRLEVGKSQGEG